MQINKKILISFAVCILACTVGNGPSDHFQNGNEKSDTSIEAIVLDFEFDGELVYELVGEYLISEPHQNSLIGEQLMFTVGHLHHNRSVARLDKLVLSNVQKTVNENKTIVTYHASLPVAWGHKNKIPQNYTFTLPRNVSYSGISDFVEKYGVSCVKFEEEDVDAWDMWYYYRPDRWGCTLDEKDVVSFTATVSVSTINTTGKYPEYDKVWEDNTLNVVAIFGKNEAWATENTDSGISSYNRFVSDIAAQLYQYNLTTIPDELPDFPGTDNPDVTLEATLLDGKQVHIVALLVGNVSTADNEDEDFDTRYKELTSNADFIVYNGHSGFGANIRALANKGIWDQGQYLIAFINGCNTYAYVDSALAEAHSAVNPDDPNGTKYLDIVTNAMPSQFSLNDTATNAFVQALLNYDNPITYEQIFKDIPSSQVVLVSGEEDNEYQPTSTKK